MIRNFDSSGRIVIPKEMRKKLGFEENSEANIELKGSEIVIKNPKKFDLKEYIKGIQLKEATSIDTYIVLEEILNQIEKDKYE